MALVKIGLNMNTVFILTEVYCLECPTIVGVFESKELAEETKINMIAKLNEDYDHYIEYYIKEYKLHSKEP